MRSIVSGLLPSSAVLVWFCSLDVGDAFGEGEVFGSDSFLSDEFPQHRKHYLHLSFFCLFGIFFNLHGVFYQLKTRLRLELLISNHVFNAIAETHLSRTIIHVSTSSI
jgi:hypothetical protein